MEGQLHYWIESSWEWLAHQYGDVHVSDLWVNPVTWQFHERYKAEGYDKARCNVHWEKYQESIKEIKIFIIKDINLWSTYRRKSVGMYAPVMRVSRRFAIQVQAVHEFTHLIQALQGRNFKETESTFNELKFAFDTRFAYFKQCKVLMDQRYNRNEDIKCII